MDSMLVAFFEQTPLGMRLLRTRRRWERGLVIVCLFPFLPFVALVGQHFWFDLQIGVWTTLVVMQGPEYRIFANGQDSGTYYHVPVQSGPIILQVSSLSEQGAQFRNLRIYPVV